jgi:thiosulfate/3-mercaptopyruvate sulfurtransferase
MKRLLAILFIAATLTASAEDKPILVSIDWVKENIKNPNLVLLQVTYLKFDFDREHIEGAQYLWPENLAPNSPVGSYNAPDIKAATELLRNYGVNENSHIVLYHVRNEVSPTARMFLTLEHLGLQGRVSFMNGGLDAWKKAGYAVSTVLTTPKKGNVKLRAGNIIVDKDYVLKTLKSENGLVVDARAKTYYDGEPVGNPRDGHIAGAKNIYFADMVKDDNTFKSLDDIRNYFTPVAGPEKEIVTYCFIGQTASVLYMAGRLLGYNMKLYDGSMQEWSRIDVLPMEKTEKTP